MKKYFSFKNIGIVISLLIAGCAGVKFKTELTRFPTDVIMLGKIPARNFFDSSYFTFPLKQLWEYDASSGFGTGTPIIAGTTMFFGTLRGEYHAVNVESGKRIGYFKTFSPVQASSAVLHNFIIYGTEGGSENLFAYRVDEGEEMWSKDVGGVSASPLVMHEKLIVGGLNDTVYCFDQYGNEHWKFDAHAEIRSSPCGDEEKIFCASTNGLVYALSVSDGSLLWKFKTGSAVYAGLTLYDSTLIVASRDSSVYLLNARSGELKRKISVGNKVMATPSCADGVLYIPDLAGSVSAFRLENGEQRWKFSAKGVINTTPVITPKAVLVVSSDKFLYALSPNDGTILWKLEFPARIKTTPLIWKGKIIIMSEDKYVYCFQ